MEEFHLLPISNCCPISANPLAGSIIEIKYQPGDLLLEVQSLREYVDSYVGGKGEIRSMEGMVQQITQDCADAVKTSVQVTAELVIAPNQKMRLFCYAHP